MRIRHSISSNIIFRIIIILVLSAVILVTAYLGISYLGHEEEIAYAGQTLTDYDELKAITIDGVKYLPDPDVYTVLLGGVDKFGDAVESGSYKNDEQIDFISLIAYNTEENTCKILVVNRDTMTDVPVLGLGGRSAGTLYEQIALSHTYGTGLKDSAENTVNAVESLLGGITIDNYAIMKMDAIPILNDMVGGVTVTLTDDMTVIDPTFTEDTTVTLMGDQALKFVRQRWYVSDNSNLARIGRQELYINGFYHNLKASSTGNNSFLANAFGAIDDYLVTNCDYVKIGEFQNYIQSYPEAQVYSLSGETKQGSDDYIEFYPDKASLNQLTVDLFYEVAEEQ
ncbi:LCP family protein [Eubacteriaceae bacterium ES3]|nr:LCP family protein [Eubacteriaceae bacterium ES3]